jgi:hypothetical protein
MSLNIHSPSTDKVERPGVVQRLAAFFGLAGLVLAWAVVLLPCLVWLLFSLVFDRVQAQTVRQQA